VGVLADAANLCAAAMVVACPVAFGDAGRVESDIAA